MKEKITVIVPIYNSQNTLDRCIKSILKQTYENLQIILINDGSTDESKKICEKYAQKDKRILLINQDNMGVSKARNIGLSKALGKYIGFVDSDDYIECDMFEILERLIEDVDLAICNFKKITNESVKYQEEDYKNEILLKKQLLERIQGQNYFQGFLWNKLYKKEIIEKNNLRFQEDIYICEDLLFNCQYISKIEKGKYTNKVEYNYIYRADSAYNGQYNKKWETVLNAYEQMIKIYNDEYKKECINLYWNFLIANFDLKQKIKKARLHKTIIDSQIENNIKQYFKVVVKSKEISKKEKAKLYLKRYFITIFMIVKNTKYRI